MSLSCLLGWTGPLPGGRVASHSHQTKFYCLNILFFFFLFFQCSSSAFPSISSFFSSLIQYFCPFFFSFSLSSILFVHRIVCVFFFLTISQNKVEICIEKKYNVFVISLFCISKEFAKANITYFIALIIQLVFVYSMTLCKLLLLLCGFFCIIYFNLVWIAYH